MKANTMSCAIAPLSRLLCAVLSVAASPTAAATLSRSVDVNAPPSALWPSIGPFCAIKDWLPAVESCTEDDGNPPTRILVTKDAKGTFEETEVARNDEEHRYTYAFRSGPLPVSQYASTITVKARRDGSSTVTWMASYVPKHSKEAEVRETLGGIYESGLAAIKVRFANAVCVMPLQLPAPRAAPRRATCHARSR